MNLKEIIFAIAILILTIFVTFYGINTVFPKPQYEDFCTSYINTKSPAFDGRGVCPAVCVPAYEVVRDQCVYNECGSGCGPDGVNTFETMAECEQGVYDMKCWERYNEVDRERARKVFFMALPLGILIIAVGAFTFGLEYVGAGLMAGGVGTLIYGSGAYWPYTQNWIRFLLSLLGLVILIWFAYWLSKRRGKEKKR